MGGGQKFTSMASSLMVLSVGTRDMGQPVALLTNQ
jgi:hypothetical protein